jgi:hypothetical protein
LGVGLAAVGKWKGWLNSKETILAALLILIPFVVRQKDLPQPYSVEVGVSCYGIAP